MSAAKEPPATEQDILNLIASLGVDPVDTTDPFPKAIGGYNANLRNRLQYCQYTGFYYTSSVPKQSQDNDFSWLDHKTSKDSKGVTLLRWLDHRTPKDSKGVTLLRWVCCACATGQPFANGENCARCKWHAGCLSCRLYLRTTNGVVGIEGGDQGQQDEVEEYGSQGQDDEFDEYESQGQDDEFDDSVYDSEPDVVYN